MWGVSWGVGEGNRGVVGGGDGAVRGRWLRGAVVVLLEDGNVWAERSGGRGGGGSGARSGIIHDPDSVRFCGDEFGDGVGEGRVGVYVEDWVGVFAVVHAAIGENDGDEVDAGVFEEWSGAGAGEELLVESVNHGRSWIHIGSYLDINVRDIPYDIPMVVDNCQRGNTFVVHQT